MQMTNWLYWSVPPQYVRRYLFTMWLVMFFIPGYIFGIKYTLFGFAVNLLWYDIVFYGWYNVKKQLDGE
jgi:hypothetical protein